MSLPELVDLQKSEYLPQSTLGSLLVLPIYANNLYFEPQWYIPPCMMPRLEYTESW